ncbi:MAG: beta-ketoacyl-ACP synthase II [Candidatus Izemoplasmatales bacterium]
MKRRVVVTGLGLLTSVGNDVKSTWEAIRAGKNGIAPITLFDASESKVKVAGEVKGFDPTPLVGPRDARRLDRAILLGIAAADEAYRSARLAPADYDPYRFGTYVASGIGGLTTIWEEAKNAVAKGLDRMSPFFIPNAIVNLIGANVSIRFGLKGPNIPIVTACSAGTNAIGEAFRAIRDGYLDLALAGGAEAAVNAFGVAGFANMKALSTSADPETASVPFDKRRSGFVMAEGAGILVLEEYERAVARKASIYGEVVGYGATSDAYHITAPDESAEAVARCMTLALADAGISPSDVGYVNAHGTSTVLNDKFETLGIKKAFGPLAYELSVSSTKSMTGHALGATGGIETILTLLAVKDGIVPPTIHYREPDPDCDLDYTPNVAKRKNLTYAMNVNLGFGGQNAAVVVKRIEGRAE